MTHLEDQRQSVTDKAAPHHNETPLSDAQGQLLDDVTTRLTCLALENPNLTSQQIARALRVRLGAVPYAIRYVAGVWHRKYLRFLIAENRWIYLRVIRPKRVVASLREAAHFFREGQSEYRAINSAFGVLELRP
ncbi:MAG: hypothetical protein ACRBCL_07220 [Maritimibacter sp.]